MNEQANKEKSSAALSSVIAAVILTTFKIVVGITTGSLGILAEAAHSSLDFVAALVTMFAVKSSGKPADKTHQYGHGKIENLSALFETLLLLATSVWIIYEAVNRLIHKSVEVDVTIWAFVVMIVSIVIDATRSRVLYRAARKYNSQALEADALHFSTDIWSSSVVILGLIGVTISDRIPGLAWLKQADAVAAIGVAVIVIYVSYNLGRRTIEGLLDTAPKGLPEKIETLVTGIPGVVDCHEVRVRSSGAEMFIDTHILVDPMLSLSEVHQLTDKIETAIRKIEPAADITVHPEPAGQQILEHENVVEAPGTDVVVPEVEMDTPQAVPGVAEFKK
jgi:cation diffusion facilitator family transporter